MEPGEVLFDGEISYGAIAAVVDGLIGRLRSDASRRPIDTDRSAEAWTRSIAGNLRLILRCCFATGPE